MKQRNNRIKTAMLAILLALCVAGCGAEKTGADADGNSLAVGLESSATSSEDVSGKEDASAQDKEAGGTGDETTSSKTDEKDAQKPEEKAEEKPVYDVGITLKEVFEQHQMKVGTCLSDYMIRDKKCTEFIKANFNSITFENHLKPDAILDQKESKKAGDLVVKFSSTTEKLLAWCKENNMAMRGHTLVWHSQTPTWIFYENFDPSKALVSREVMLQRMESYISQVFSLLEEKGYLELFYAYDIVNEAWMEDGTKRDSLWLKTIGDDYLWQAFYLADKYAPEYIDLYYNDYNEQFKTDTLYEFVQTLVDEEGNYLIDGIGFQAHLYTEDSLEDYFATMDKIASLGIKVNLTELDVCLGSWPEIKPATEENLQAQGQYYYNLISGILQRVDEGKVHMDALTFWGFNDSLSWRRERNPLLLNAKYEPKYAYYGALQIKENAGFAESKQ
ncbi:MAG: endo-1,4-beta-xylanase [Lachnospiraceae bacterium]|nr:endo-1,4-beta-xylanase [Lachnospiraceae bacterium]